MEIVYILLAVAVVALLIIFLNNNKRETFDITRNLQHQAYQGKFDDCYQIGTNYNLSSNQCKNFCNKIHSCKGVSYRHPFNECRLYNDTTLENSDPRYKSWFKLKEANHIY